MNIYHQYYRHYLGIQKSFEKALISYDNEAVVQHQMGTLLTDYLTQIKESHQRVLDLGCGTGLITRYLCETLPILSIYINDFSPLLLKAARSRLQNFHAKPLLFNFDQQWKSDGLYDLIFSNMAFQWSFNICALLKKSFIYLSQDGILAFSLPLIGSFSEINPQQRISLHTFDDIYQFLIKIGFRILHTDHLYQCQKFKTHREALKSIKGCGANYVPQNKDYIMIDRSKLSLPSTLTYKIGIFIVSKGLN